MNIMLQIEYLEIGEKTNVVSVIGADTYLGSHMVEHLYQDGKCVWGFRDSDEFDFSQNRSSRKKRKSSHILLPQLFQNRFTSVMSLILALKSILLKLEIFATLASKMDSSVMYIFFPVGRLIFPKLKKLPQKELLLRKPSGIWHWEQEKIY